MEATFQKVKALVKKRVPAHTYTMWIEPLTFSNTGRPPNHTGSANFFIKKRFQALYADLVLQELNRISGKPLKLRIIVAGKAGAPWSNPPWFQRPKASCRCPKSV